MTGSIEGMLLMGDNDWLAERFEENRTHLRAVAYRMLGSVNEADDAVQEAWLRLDRSDTRNVENLSGWLTTVVARVCLDMLRSRTSRREDPLDAHMPEAIARREDGLDPEHEALLGDSIGLALLVLLERLGPAERVAFVLHDMFAVPFDEIAPIVGRTPTTARQLASRARRRVQGASAPDTDPAHRRQVVDAFLAASAVADTFAGRARAARPALVDGAAGLVWAQHGRPTVAFSFTITGGRIAGIDLIADPERLRLLDVVLLDE